MYPPPPPEEDFFYTEENGRGWKEVRKGGEGRRIGQGYLWWWHRWRSSSSTTRLLADHFLRLLLLFLTITVTVERLVGVNALDAGISSPSLAGRLSFLWQVWLLHWCCRCCCGCCCWLLCRSCLHRLLVAACLTPLHLLESLSWNLFFETLKTFTFDFWGRSVGGDGDFFDFEWEPEMSLGVDKFESNANLRKAWF